MREAGEVLPLVGWVRVRGSFRYEGMAAPGARQGAIVEAEEQIFTSDAATGALLGASLQGAPPAR
jgi:hypothetical protein